MVERLLQEVEKSIEREGVVTSMGAEKNIVTV